MGIRLEGYPTLPNARLAAQGVDRQAKRRALTTLEKAGLITVERRGRKPPRITLVGL
jgi:DNA-binding transcriptional ArsR family regulator